MFDGLELECPVDANAVEISESLEALHELCRVADAAAQERTAHLAKAGEANDRAERAARQAEELSRRRDGLLGEWGFVSVAAFNSARNDLVDYSELTRSLPNREREMSSALERQEAASKEVDEVAKVVREAESRLEEFVARNQLTPGLDRDGLTNLIDATGDYKKALDELASVRADTSKMLRRWDTMLERYRPLLQTTELAADIDGAEPSEVIGRINKAVERLKWERDQGVKRNQKLQELATSRQRLVKTRESARSRKTAVEDLLRSVETTSKDEYQRWCADAEQLRLVQQRVAEKSAAIGAALGERDMSTLSNRLRGPDWTGEDAKLREMEEEHAALENQLHELSQTIGADEQLQAQHEQSEELAQHRQLEAAAQAQLEQSAEEWLVWSTAVEVVDRARERFERERQPKVLQRASHYFALLTDGAYKGIHVRLGEQDMHAVLADETRVPLLHLSRGTVEPLYLALRLALIDDFARNGKGAPPILMDDILVNFDDFRARNAAAAVRQLGDRTQVLLLTCHERTIDSFKSLDGDVNIVRVQKPAG